jgi:gamma-glutamylaminecyclotransferase
MATHLVFVYGTLKHGKYNHYLLEDSECLGEYFTSKDYTLIMSNLPYLIKRKGHGCLGEVYKINSRILSSLDKLEHHPEWYERKEIEVIPLDGSEKLKVWAYVHPDIFKKGILKDYAIIRSY